MHNITVGLSNVSLGFLIILLCIPLVKRKIKMNNQELRNKLECICRTQSKLECICFNSNRDKYREDIKALKEVYNHSIFLEKKEKHDSYNCFMYAFDLHIDPIRGRIFDNCKTCGDPFPDGKFISHCLEKDFLVKTKWKDIKDGDVVMYFDNDNPKHAGKIFSKRIISKWGDLDLWNHDIWEIPANHGKKSEFYKQIEKNNALKCYSDYAGVSLEHLSST